MIDQHVFRAEWALLCERWNRKPSQGLAARYYQYLSARMDTEGFRAACLALFASREFFPGPEDFLQAVRPDAEEEALGQWELCQRIMEGETELLDRMTLEGRRAVEVLEGPGRLRLTPLASVPFVRKEFLAVYRDLVRAGSHGERLAGTGVTSESRRIMGEVMRLGRGEEET